MNNMSVILKRLEVNLDAASKLARITNKSSVLVIQQFPVIDDTETLITPVRESVSNIISFIELGDIEILNDVLKLADGKVDGIIMDADLKLPQSINLVKAASSLVKLSKIFFYSDTETWAEAAFHFILGREGTLVDKSIMLIGEGLLHLTIMRKLEILTSRISSQPINDEYDLVIGASYKKQCQAENLEKTIKADARIYDVGIGNFAHDQLIRLRSKTRDIYRFDNRAGVSSMVLAKLETDHLLNRVMGKTTIKGVNVIAGGIMGEAGDIIVDDIKNPAYVVGVANGAGFLKTDNLSTDEQQRLDLIRSII